MSPKNIYGLDQERARLDDCPASRSAVPAGLDHAQHARRLDPAGPHHAGRRDPVVLVSTSCSAWITVPFVAARSCSSRSGFVQSLCMVPMAVILLQDGRSRLSWPG